MATNLATSSEYEAQANRLRAQIGGEGRRSAIRTHAFEPCLRSSLTHWHGRSVMGWRV